MAKIIDLTKTVYELTETYPELIPLMKEMGFAEVTKEGMRHTLGKKMTLPKGAQLKHIPLDQVVQTLVANGFTVVGDMPVTTSPEPAPKSNSSTASPDSPSRIEQLKGYLRRLGDGEDLESVRADFARHFGQVDATEIMQAEQDMLRDGTALEEVQRLCDLHAALFKGAITAEHVAQAKKATDDPVMQQKIILELSKRDSYPQKDYSRKDALAAELGSLPGHPLHTLSRENQVLLDLLAQYRREPNDDLLAQIRELSIHYAKKGDLIYPHLKVQYGITGPSDVMWTVDDEIRDELSALGKEAVHDTGWQARLDDVLHRVEEMVDKEQHILFPNCAVNFTEEDWYGIYQDAKDYENCFGVESAIWEAAEAWKTAADREVVDGTIHLPGGQMTLAQLEALLDTIPLEITFIDAQDLNRYFNDGDGPKVFKRPSMALGRSVYSCHPPKIEPMVRAIIDDFRAGRADSVPVWMNKGGKPFLVTYMAIRDKAGQYLGTAEFVQDMTQIQAHFTR